MTQLANTSARAAKQMLSSMLILLAMHLVSHTVVALTQPYISDQQIDLSTEKNSIFSKIRIMMPIISFLILFFIIGLIKKGSAMDCPGECCYVALPLPGVEFTLWDQSRNLVPSEKIDDLWDKSTGYWRTSGWDKIQILFPVGTISYHGVPKLYAYIAGNWKIASNMNADLYFYGNPRTVDDLDARGCQKCINEAAQLSQDCGGDESIAWEWTDYDACQGRCLPCISNLQPGQETLAEASSRCAGIGQSLLFYSIEQCTGVCAGANNGQPDYPDCPK